MRQIPLRVFSILLAFVLISLTGCGGGQGPADASPAVESVLRSKSARSSAPLPESFTAMRKEGVGQISLSKTNLVEPTAFFDWAELRFPQLFPGEKETKFAGDLTYRFYPENELYFAILNGEVLVLAPLTGNRVVSLGPLANFTCAVFPEVCQPPVAVVGASQSVKIGELVTLDGSRSFDPSGDTLTYQWSIAAKPVGSLANLTSNNAVQTTLVPDVAGKYEIKLTVSDGDLVSEAATVFVTSNLNNAAPVSAVGVTRNVSTGVAVILDGSSSSDRDGDPLSFNWRLAVKPTGSSASLLGVTTVRPTFTADVAGQYVVELVVSDGKSFSDSAALVLIASNTNAAPTAVPGGSQSVSTGGVVFLNGRASFDPNGDPLTYEWTVVTRPAGSAASLSSPTSATPTFTADYPGNYVVSLVVSDGKLKSPSTTVTVSASGVLVAPPRTCCTVCTTGKPCGASCISRSYTCRVGSGCAC